MSDSFAYNINNAKFFSSSHDQILLFDETEADGPFRVIKVKQSILI